jgi:hypothetical protein
MSSSFQVISPFRLIQCHNIIEQTNHSAVWLELVLRAVLFLLSPTVLIALKISLVLGVLEEIGLLIYGLRNLQGVIMAILLWRLLGHHALVYSMDLNV